MNAWVKQDCREVRHIDGVPYHFPLEAEQPIEQLRSPYGQPGDRLWVRETWALHADFPEMTHRAVYRAEPEYKYDAERWRPSIHMPRAASRILIEVTSVRVERL